MHKFLTENKIYFESLLPVVIFLFTIATYFSSQKIAEVQLALAKQTIEPIFSIENLILRSSESSFYTEEHLLVKNYGPRVSNVKSRIYTFIDVEYGDYPNRISVRLPAYGYFYSTHTSDADVYSLFLHRGGKNNERFFELYKEGLDNKGKEGVVLLTLTHLSEVRYLNSFNEQKNSYFLGKDRVVDDKIAYELINKHTIEDSVKLDQIKLKELFTHIEKLNEHGRLDKYRLEKVK